MATREEMQTIHNQAYDDVAREMEREGVTLTHAQFEETDEGVECSPAEREV
jgi:hypothetical protein